MWIGNRGYSDSDAVSETVCRSGVGATMSEMSATEYQTTVERLMKKQLEKQYQDVSVAMQDDTTVEIDIASQFLEDEKGVKFCIDRLLPCEVQHVNVMGNTAEVIIDV